MNYRFEDCIQQALDQVSAWDPELPPEQFCQAVNDQARLMAGIDLEFCDTSRAVHFHATLRF